jgi:hypothetical protein
MNDLINPYDLGATQLVESYQKLNINELVDNAQKQLKLRLVEAQIDVLGITINLMTSKTRFNGERIWFQCPRCNRRSGIILRNENLIGCRQCLSLKYKKQRYKGMIENQIDINR